MIIFEAGINDLAFFITHLVKVVMVTLKQNVNSMIWHRKNFRKERKNKMKIE